jgi:hypothetical protein
MLATRRLVGLNGLLVRRLQDRFRTRPGSCCLARVEQGRLGMDKACQVGAVEVALSAGATPWTMVPALAQPFGDDPPTLARLGEFSAPRVDSDQLPASTFSQAGEASHEQPRCAAMDRAAEAPLPGVIGEGLCVDPQRW